MCPGDLAKEDEFPWTFKQKWKILACLVKRAEGWLSGNWAEGMQMGINGSCVKSLELPALITSFYCCGHNFSLSSCDTQKVDVLHFQFCPVLWKMCCEVKFCMPEWTTFSVRKSQIVGGGRGPFVNQGCEGVHTLNRLLLVQYTRE